MKRILFVDDDPYVLQALQNVLRRHRPSYEMVFVSGGEAALEEVKKGPFEVVVSDMRMPVMDGATLLAHIMGSHPATVRMILSGQASNDLITHALRVSHRYFEKPCKMATLWAAVESACHLDVLLGDPVLRARVGGLSHLAPLAGTCEALAALFASPGPTPEAVASVVELDPALSANVLHVVSSSYFGLNAPTTSIAEAVLCLGVGVVSDIVTDCRSPPLLPGSPPVPRAGERLGIDLVHDVGRLVLAAAMPERCAEYAELTATPGGSIDDAERKVFGATHAEAGRYLFALWGIPTLVATDESS